METAALTLFGIQDFFDDYAMALRASDAKRIAGYYALPCLMTSDERTTSFTDATALEALYVQGFSFLKQHGISHAVPEVRSRLPLSAQIVSAKVRWQYFDAQERPLYSCDYHYILHRSKEGAWKIEVSVSVNERERMQAWMAESKGA